MGLVRALVPRFLGRGIEYDDLFQAGVFQIIYRLLRFKGKVSQEIRLSLIHIFPAELHPHIFAMLKTR